MRTLLAIVALMLIHTVGLAEESPPQDQPDQLLEAVVVSGIQPGPGLWRVSKGDHEMWVMGTLAPLPKRMEWSADEVKLVIARSQEVLLTPGGELGTDIGFFRGLTLLPAALGARKNPEKRKLEDLLSAELYARWRVLKREFLGRSNRIEKRRPLLAANKLFDKALSRSGLSADNVVEPVVKRVAKRAKVKITHPMIEILVEDPKQAIKDFAATDLEDLECFEQTLDRLETDLPMMVERANAWAVGDIEELQSLPFVDQRQSCADALLKAAVMKERGLADLRQRLAAKWLQAAEAALTQNLSTFAILPIEQILKPDGYIAALQARGYSVEAPLPL